MTIFVHIVLTAILVYSMTWTFKQIKEKVKKKKTIWVIEDNPWEVELIKLKITKDGYRYKYFSSAKGILGPLSTSTPDALIVDHILGNSVTGDKIFKICRDNKINCLMVTGYDDEIAGVDKKYIVKKKSDMSHIDRVNDWLHSLFSDKGEITC